MSETSKVLTQKPTIKAEEIQKYITELLWTHKLGENRFRWLPPSKRGYGFRDFFFDLNKNLLKFKKSLAGTIHLTIRLNHKIKKIATFDINDFGNIPDFEVINPDEIDKYL